MDSYSQLEIFSAEEVKLLRRAEKFVAFLPNDMRCHEVARATAQVLGIDPACIQDGFYGFVDHTWIWTRPLDTSRIITPRLGFPNILDPYCVGSLPQVSLVDCQHTSLPHLGWGYRPSTKRTDIQEDQIQEAIVVAKKCAEITLGVHPWI